ncbi:MAG: MBL fold metallo-hydrolase, partial [Gemmatimonadaceae bacterium]|nr:MBL fold metallo-hydrolase [Gemmatimonadaceae bacterium]
MNAPPDPASLAAPAMPLVETRQLGALRIHALQAGGQKLDGGAMFGVVPKPLWERKIPADERNRIGLGMRCLLIEHPDGLVLVDSGAGNKESEKFYSLYGMDAPPPADSPTQLELAIAAAGFSTADVRTVISSHLHFDHAGGNTRRRPDGSIAPSFPNARYVVRQGEWDWAHDTNERTAASYFAHNYDPLET